MNLHLAFEDLGLEDIWKKENDVIPMGAKNILKNDSNGEFNSFIKVVKYFKECFVDIGYSGLMAFYCCFFKDW